MSWLQKLLPPKIKRAEGAKKSIPEGLWRKCPSCEAVLYATDLEQNLSVCPKCGHHHRLKARERLDLLLVRPGALRARDAAGIGDRHARFGKGTAFGPRTS